MYKRLGATIVLSASLIPVPLAMAEDAAAARSPANPHNQVVVSPDGPRDGGDFGPHTPGTKTSGLQEALDAAKDRAQDVYIAGGSWTADKTQPVVYNLHETLRVPWMQNFRLDSGHCVLNYTPRTGDAVVFDSQMSCAYRLGLIVSMSDGAVVRMRPTTAGPDRFKVITSTEFVFNALVGGGGAWPGGEAYNNQLDKSRRWVGTGLWLDAGDGSIDANKFTVIETVGCQVGLRLTGAVSRNTIEDANIHLCRDHIEIGGPADPKPCDNRIEAFMDSQGIEPTSGARVFGARNLLTLSTRQTPASMDLVFEPTAEANVVLLHSPLRVLDRSTRRNNRILGALAEALTPSLPATGQACFNSHPFPVEVRIVQPGQVTGWSEKTGERPWLDIQGAFFTGQSFVLNPGDSVRIDYSQPPAWRWKAVR